MVMRTSVDSPVARALREGNEGNIVTALRRMPEDAAEYGAPVLAKEAGLLLRTTTSHRVRNAAAIGLADMRAPNAVSSIVEVLRESSMADSAGTLLFALGELNALVPLDVVVNIIEHGSFESRAEALIAMEEGRTTAIGAAKAREAHSTLKRFSEDGSEEERAEAAKEALGYLERAINRGLHER